MAFACNAQFTDDEFEYFRHISGLKREQKLWLPLALLAEFFFRPRWEPVRRLTREKNIVLVVSPLINLMKDQGSRLNSRGIWQENNLKHLPNKIITAS